MAASISWPHLDKLYTSGDVISSTRKIKIRGSSLNSLPRFSENLYHYVLSEIVITFENGEIFFTYYFSYVRDYKAVLMSGSKENV